MRKYKKKIILFPLGLPGSGKSTFCKKFKTLYPNETLLLERDALMLEMFPGMNYSETYNCVYQNSEKKSKFQNEWFRLLDDTFKNENFTILIIDTQQTIYSFFFLISLMVEQYLPNL